MKIPAIKSKDLIDITDFTKNEIFDIFKLASTLKAGNARGKCQKKYLCGKSLAMIFEKSSTRTRVSFETGMYQLGGNALFLNSSDIQIGRGETMADTAKVLSRYVDAIMIRTFAHASVIELAGNADIPVINGLSDSAHPCQALADFFSIYEREQDFSKVKLAYIGDSNNVSNSLLLGAAILGMNISIASPVKYSTEKNILGQADEYARNTGSIITITDDIDEALKGADFLYTDVWVSMGQEKEQKPKKKALARYKISGETLQKCAPGCLVMHCLPAHRGEEIDSEIMDSARSIIFEQAENRLHVQKAVLCSLIKK
ncbi:MAG: ornithine carbamoyltransferase [Spirochaetes bacterium]|nr:ornithine carbamoyltransferase [Spirochaetota bacterium]